MKILIVGAGAAGLSFAILMAESGGPHDITVIERGAADERPGFGITLRDDTVSFLSLDRTLPCQHLEGRAFWRRGEPIVDLPNPPLRHLVTFSRAALVNTLVERSQRAGVRLTYQRDAERLSAADFEGYDLVVAADGANSAVRRLHAEAFAPVIEAGKNRFGWFGVGVPFDKLTILLRDEQGAMLGWGYKYSESVSTFIVESTDASLARHGLVGLSPEETATKVGALFRDDLRGSPVFCGPAVRWSHFPKVSCRRLVHANIALIGDAAHTTHFSQGFGTMFAFDDALALQTALAEGDVATALASYEATQLPKIAEFQDLSFSSMRWSENLVEAAERGDEPALRDLIAARWPGNVAPPGPLTGFKA
jgi:2-polyprenyl-6-methoxyphenol hydroxylase-like FAD-dependent oxidoreductase